MTSPIVSIITVTYNRPKKLQQAIQSIFDQTLKNWEYIILDYTEDKEINEKVRLWAIQDKRVKWIWHSKNIKNISHCWNEGLDIITGKYWCTLDDDNIKYPEFLDKMTNYLENNPEKYTVVCPCDDVNGNNRSILFLKPVNFSALLNMNHIDSGQCVHRKSLIDKIGYFDEQLMSFDDWDYMLRIYNIDNKSGSAFGWLAGNTLCLYNKHSEQRTHVPEIRESWKITIPLIRSKIRKEKIRVKVVNTSPEIIDALSLIQHTEMADTNADIVLLNNINLITIIDILRIISNNPEAKIVALVSEYYNENIEFMNYIDWIITNNSYDKYIEKMEGIKKKQVISWNVPNDTFKNISAYSELLWKIINCVRSVRYNVKLS